MNIIAESPKGEMRY